MDFQPQIKFNHPTGVPIPFFMAYPGYLTAFPQNRSEEKKWSRDFEYLRQTYPVQVRVYQRRVEEILDKVDYEGSMIYDEYPDRMGIQSLSRMVANTLIKESGEEQEAAPDNDLEGLIQVLVCNEICRRRHKTQSNPYHRLGQNTF